MAGITQWSIWSNNNAGAKKKGDRGDLQDSALDGGGNGGCGGGDNNSNEDLSMSGGSDSGGDGGVGGGLVVGEMEGKSSSSSSLSSLLWSGNGELGKLLLGGDENELGHAAAAAEAAILIAGVEGIGEEQLMLMGNKLGHDVTSNLLTATTTASTNLDLNDSRNNSATPTKLRLRLIATKLSTAITRSPSPSAASSVVTSPVLASFSISSPLVSHSSHTLALRHEVNDANGESLTLQHSFYREAGPTFGGRPTYHSSHSAVRPTTAVPSASASYTFSDHLSSLGHPDPITLHKSRSANDLSLFLPLDECLPPIPPSLWGSRQQYACKHADTFTAGQVAALSDNHHHHHHHHHHHNNQNLDLHHTTHAHTHTPTDENHSILNHEISPAVVVVASPTTPPPPPPPPSAPLLPPQQGKPKPALGPPLTFSCEEKISPLSPEDAIASPGRRPCHETSSSSSLTSPKPTPSLLFDPETFSFSEQQHDRSLSTPPPRTHHVSPVNDLFSTPPSLLLLSSGTSVVEPRDTDNRPSELLTELSGDASSSSLSPSSTSSPPSSSSASSPAASSSAAAAAGVRTAEETVNVNLLAEFPWCAAGPEADPLASPTYTPAQRFLPPLPPPPSPSSSSVAPQSGKERSALVIPTLILEQFFSDSAMPKLRSSDSGVSSRTRPDPLRPTSFGGANVPKAPSSPHSTHSIGRMFSTKIRGLLHSRDRRASSPLSPPNVASSIHEAQFVSASVPSSPRTTAHYPLPLNEIHPSQLSRDSTEEYVGYAASGHSSYRSADSPTTRTETTSQDSSTTTDSTGIRSGRSSFQSFHDEKRRSDSPSSPITPDGDYMFARSSPEKTGSDNYYPCNSFDDDDGRSQEVLFCLDEGNLMLNQGIPSVNIEAPTPTVNKHSSHSSAVTASSRIPRPMSSRSRSASPAPQRAPSFAASIREEITGRETPSFLAPRPAPIPIPVAGSAKPALHPSAGGSKLLRTSTMSSRSSAVNQAKAPLSLTPRVRTNSITRPSTANRPGTSFSAMSMNSNRSMHMHSPKSPGMPMDNLADVDENIVLPPPHSPGAAASASAFNPDKFASRGSRGNNKPSSLLHEIVIPPQFDAGSFRTAPVSPTAASEYSFTAGLSPKRIPDDMQNMRPIVFNTETSDNDVSIPFFPVAPAHAAPQAAATAVPVVAAAAEAPRRSKTVSLRHAFTRLNSHVNKRGANHPPITPDIISRPSNAIKYGGPHPLSSEISHSLDNNDDACEKGHNHSGSSSSSSRPRATSGGTLPSSSSSFARWKSGHARSSSNPSNLPPVLPPSQQQLHQPVYYSPPGTVPTSPTLSATTTSSPTGTGVQAVALTDEERSELARMPGTIFLKTARSGESADGELIIEEHRLKPRKGMQGSGDAGKCRFCRRGPFPNMWVCLDSCGFVMCRVCANESVQGGEAELF
ncbi:uncharacterized protein H6S33_009954 [Morchella sextelata]|uniref:uncharacterized protein n=1 Tax=Morchella sextelata TaxID=1174677 RepID=UPI001D04B9FE|nr:uncharacterized protein H6S33_009954 [Morchella sextelata]KAH0611902.1 hypothetical protein H6S33_009954 [Morchella sextelata]